MQVARSATSGVTPLLRRLVTTTTSARPLAVARIAVGAGLLVKLAVLLPVLLRLGDPTLLRIPMASWLPVLPGEAVPTLVALWIAGAVGLMVGWRTRLSGAVLAAVLLTTLLGDQQLYSNHLYLGFTLAALLTVADSGAALSLDARRRGARQEVAAWPVTLLKLQVTLVYGFAGLAKINLVYVSGAVLNAQLGWGSLLPFPEALRRWEVLAPLALLSILTELFLAGALWTRRWRPVGLSLGLAFHVAIIVGMDPTGELIVFAVLMFSLYLLFLDAEARSRTVLWDDACSFCGSTVRALRRLDWLRVHRFVGTSAFEVLPGGVTRAEVDEAVQLLGPGGRASGFDAVRLILERLPVSFLWAPYLRNRWIRRLGDRAYRMVAARRRCGLRDRPS